MQFYLLVIYSISVNDISKCSLSMPHDELNSCLKNLFMVMISKLKNGIPDLNIPAIDPFVIEKAKYQIKSDDFQLRVVLKNMVILGSSLTDIQDVKFEKNGHILSLHTHSYIPSMNVTGSYKAEMIVAEANHYGGNFKIELYDMECDHEFQGEIIEENGKRRVKLVSFNVRPTIGKMNMKATGFDPDPTISEFFL